MNFILFLQKAIHYASIEYVKKIFSIKKNHTKKKTLLDCKLKLIMLKIAIQNLLMLVDELDDKQNFKVN